jgi:ubiquinol-cytochrome c reductase cytochrome c subunit
VVLLLGLLVTGALYAVAAPTSRAASVSAADADPVEAGRDLFLSNCSTCHGLNAEGTGDGPTLIGVGAAAVDFQVETGRMPLAQPGPQAPKGRIRFNSEQIDQLAAYVASLAPGPPIPSADQLKWEEADAARGRGIFNTNCSMCHNFAGSGGALTQGKYAPSLKGVEPVHIYEAMLTGPQNMPVFSDTQITPEDKRDIIKYLKTIEAEPAPVRSLGSIGPVAEGLFGWIVGIGLLALSAVWLAQKAK